MPLPLKWSCPPVAHRLRCMRCNRGINLLCRLNQWHGKIAADPAEVHAWRFARLSDIQADMKLHPQDYTAWFRAEVHAVVTADQKRQSHAD